MDEKKTGFWSMDIAIGRKRYWIIYATALLLLLSGILAAKEAGERTDLNMRRAVASQTRHIAEVIPVDSVRKLSFSEADTNLPEFRQLCSQMKAYAEASGIRSLYSMALRNNKLVFGPETLNPDDPNASPPGTVYRTPTKKDFEIFNTGDAAVQGPDSDEYGDFVTATAPVVDPHTGKVLMTVGIDIEASVWQTEIRKAQWIPFLTAMAPLAMLFIGFITLKIRQRLPATRHWKLRHVEAFTCAAIMLLLTFTAAALLHFADTKAREENFRNQAQIKAEIYTTKFKSIHADLNLLDSFFESSDHISRQEFRLYSSTLIKKNQIAACFWIPEISAAEAVRFTKQVREDGLPEFSIWQRNEQNTKVPAQGSVFFPVLYVEPFSVHEKALGFDLYSEPLRKAAIIEALSTGLPVATEPVTLISTSPQADQVLIVQPVQSKQGRGVAGFVLSPKEFLTNFSGTPAGEPAELSVSLLELRAGKPPLWLACARESSCGIGSQPVRKGLYSSTPGFAFGKTYEVLIVPEPHWLEEHPLNAGRNALFVGFILTLLLTTLVATLSNRPFILEQLVKRRTAELLRLSTAIEQSPEAVLITDSDGIIQYVNPAFETITGYSLNEALGQTARILKSGQHDEAFYSDLWKTIAAGNIWRGRVVNKRKNGDFYTEEASISPVRDTDGTISGYVAVKRNITEELFKEEQFRQSQKMEAVGQLAGGIAHDFNNLLQAILGFSEILMTGMATGSAEHRNAEEIHKSAKRGAELIRQLLAFSRKQPVERKQINLNTELRDAEVLLQILLGSDVTYHFELADDLCPIYADHGQLTQIIMNLAVNARDAMPNGGRLTFATENITFDSQSINTIPGAVQGSFVCLSVTDTGCGMSREVHDRLFEPFFTTKKVGQGTGLGLPVVYGIVKQSNGWIHVYSEEGHGSSFKIYLPTCKADVLSGALEISAHNGRILLVEDEADIRNLVIRILEMSGYELVAVSCAEDAIQVYEKEKGLFNMLFSDMILPGQTGIELADTLRIKNPALPVLLYSGYQDQRERWSNLDVKGYHFLKKPFSVTELLSAVNDTLNEAAQ